MDYIFGYVNRDSRTVENLKTVGKTHTNFEGFVEVVRNYSDCTITDRFQIRSKYQSAEDAEGNAYDWYTISDHYRYVDKYTPNSERLIDAEEVSKIVFVTLAEAGSIDSATAREHAEIFGKWAYPVNYQAGNIRQHEGKLYKCLTGHTSQEDWTPEAAPSLWVQIADPAEEWPAWSQPIGAADAYPRGSKVSHQGEYWESEADSNVWEPGVYGWIQVKEKEGNS